MTKLILIFISILALLKASQAAATPADTNSTPPTMEEQTAEAIREALQPRTKNTPLAPGASTSAPAPRALKAAAISEESKKAESSSHADVVLGAGASTELAVPSSVQIRVSNSSVLAAEDLGARLRIIGKKPGNALVQAGAKTWRVSVLSASDWASYEHLQAFVRASRGLVLTVREGVAQIEGRLLRASDWRDLAQLDDLTYHFAALVDVSTEKSLRAEIFQDLAAAELPAPSLRLSPAAKVFLSQEQEALQPAYERALRRWGFAVEVNPTLVTLAPLVRIKILVAEVDKSFAQNLGVNWQQTLSAQLLPTWIGPKQASNVTLSLEAMETTTKGHILASPNLLCRSGKKAEFLAGGEFPIKITNFAAQDVTWKPYGVVLKVEPLADSVGHMSIAIKTEVSDVSGISVDGIPGISTYRIESHFDLARPQTIALSGLIKKKTKEQRDGLPFLSRIPILGSLFSSRAFNNDETELMIFVTPEVVHPEEGDTI